jgi:hypothetical protein
MTPVRNKRKLHPKLPRRRVKAPRLIPQLPRKNQNSFLLCSHRKKKGEYLIVIASEEAVAQASFSGLRLFYSRTTIDSLNSRPLALTAFSSRV